MGEKTSCLWVFFILQNVTELQLVDNPAWCGDKESIKGDKYDDLQCARFICPVVGLEMNGRHRLVLRAAHRAGRTMQSANPVLTQGLLRNCCLSFSFQA